MNEDETRAELIDEQLKVAGWIRNSELGMQIHRNFYINRGEIQADGKRKKKLFADYVLEYNYTKLAVIEAKSMKLDVGEGVAQAKEYSKKLNINTTFSANGKEIYQIIHDPHREGKIASFPTPQELWARRYPDSNAQFEKFSNVPFQPSNPKHEIRCYQEIAINKVMQAIANGEKRILLTLATGTGKTFIASQIAWKLFNSKWALQGERRPRILFLADRNILASQALESFGVFDNDAIMHITPSDIAKRGEVPKNANVFFAIFQAFMSGKEKTGKHYYESYEKDFFDFIIVDECHRGGARDESPWREILEYFEDAVQLGLTATPKRDNNRDTYAYFGNPVFTYSLKEGIGDGFLTPFQVRHFQSNIDGYTYHPDDDIERGNIDEEKLYTEKDFNRIIEIEAREQERVNNLLKSIKPDEKTLVFCANQRHAAKIRDLINKTAQRGSDYCVRVTSNDGTLGDGYLKKFRDVEETKPTILTTSQKLTTGVDALDVRNIALLRPVNSMIEFKQIIGRGTRIYEGKHYFTVIDFVKAYEKFSDPEWDGQPVKLIDGDSETITGSHAQEYIFNPELSETESAADSINEEPKPEITSIVLSDNRQRDIISVEERMFEVAGELRSPKNFLRWLFEDFRLPELLGSEENLCETWGNPEKRKEILQKLEKAGCPIQYLEQLKDMIRPKGEDLFDLIRNVAFATLPISRTERVEERKMNIYKGLNDKEREFADHILSRYLVAGDKQFDEDISEFLNLIYGTTRQAMEELGEPDEIRRKFIKIQQQLYA